MLDGVESTGGKASGFDREELSKILDALPNDGWIVDEVLSSSQFETTQIVHRDKGVVAGRFVRKIFTRETGLGAAYQRILAAQIAGLRFEHLPFVYDVVEVDEGIAVVTQLVQGETLQQLVDSGARGTKLTVDVGRQLCDAMVELHESFAAPVVHRDLKPSNIVIADGKLVLIDLGIARAWRVDGTRDTVRLGTPGYAPPEQFGYGQTTPQSDIYAAGMVMAFCFTGEGPTSALRESRFGDARIPAAFREVMVNATALDSAQRYASARDMKAAIDRAYAQQALSQNNPMTKAAGGTLADSVPSSSASASSAAARSLAGGAPDPAAGVPATGVPATGAYATNAPSTGSSATGASATRVPATDAPAAGASATNAPAIGAPAAGAPATNAPATGAPAAGAPVAGAPAMGASAANASSRPSPGLRISDMVGIVWNVVLAIVWVFLTVMSLVTAFGGRTEFLSALPLWFRLFEYFALIIVPSAAIGIVLADKRRLRRRFPLLGRWSFPKMALACIALIVVIYTATVAIHSALFG